MKNTTINIRELNNDSKDIKATIQGTQKAKLSDFILCFGELISKYGDVYVDINSIKFVEEND